VAASGGKPIRHFLVTSASQLSQSKLLIICCASSGGVFKLGAGMSCRLDARAVILQAFRRPRTCNGLTFLLNQLDPPSGAHRAREDYAFASNDDDYRELRHFLRRSGLKLDGSAELLQP